MSGLLNAVLVGAGLSLVLSLVAWGLATTLQTRVRGGETLLWQSARAFALLPLLMAPLIYAVPEVVPVEADYHLAMTDFAGAGPSSTGAVEPIVGQRGIELPSLTNSLLLMYAIGLALSVLAAWQRHLWRRRVLSDSRPATAAERRPLDIEAARVGIAAPALRVSTRPTSPFITGWQAVMVVPENLYDDRRTLRFAFVHELVHLARGDERDRLIGSALVTIFWFHLPLRLIERGLNTARELACDANALEVLGGTERKPYAAALIEMMRAHAAPVSAFGSDNRRHRRMRIKAIMAARPGQRGSRTLMAAVVLAAFVPITFAQAMVTDRRIAPASVELVVPTISAAPEVPAIEAVPTLPAADSGDGERPRAPKPDLSSVPEVPDDAPAALVSAPAAPVPTALPNRVSPTPAPSASAVSSQVLGAPLPTSGAAAQSVPTADVFTHRVTEGRISSPYGSRPARPAGAPTFHGGTDVAAPSGTTLHAPGPGVITHAANGLHGNERWGMTVIIDHGDGWETLYAHMQGFDVEVGDIVRAGDQIGRVGETGAATGPHVHVEVRRNGERVNPAGQLPGLD
jgi:murein DD-endopeptidase MepM/ murein hydrolase activator NlpD